MNDNNALTTHIFCKQVVNIFVNLVYRFFLKINFVRKNIRRGTLETSLVTKILRFVEQ